MSVYVYAGVGVRMNLGVTFLRKSSPQTPFKRLWASLFVPASLLAHLIGVPSANNVTQSGYCTRVQAVLSRSRGPYPNDHVSWPFAYL